MIVAIADTNILIELYRNDLAAKAWFRMSQDIAITSVTWLEFMQGARGKLGQTQCLRIIAQFGLEFLTHADQQWAMDQLLKYRLSHGVDFKDCLIASTCYRLKIPRFTNNVKDFVPILGTSLVIKPY